jgi:hypothetical protein
VEESSKEGYGSKRAVLPMTIMMISQEVLHLQASALLQNGFC